MSKSHLGNKAGCPFSSAGCLTYFSMVLKTGHMAPRSEKNMILSSDHVKKDVASGLPTPFLKPNSVI